MRRAFLSLLTRPVLLCALALTTSPAYPASLTGTEWKPTRIGELAMPAETEAFVQFRSKGRLSGLTGCNRILAQYTASGGVIFIGPVAATRMACAESVMSRELALVQALEQARTYRRETADLVLFDADGQPILELRQTDWD